MVPVAAQGYSMLDTSQSTSQAVPDERRRFHLFRSLKTRLRWSYALASFIPLALLGAILINTSFSTQRQNTYNSQQTAADWVAREVGNSLSAIDGRLLGFGDRLRPEQSAADLQQDRKSTRLNSSH